MMLVFGVLVAGFLCVAYVDSDGRDEFVGMCPAESEVSVKWTPWWSQSRPHAVIGINNTEQRLDYADTVLSILEELGARVVNVSGVPAGRFREEIAPQLTGYWGLHMNNLAQYKEFGSQQQLNSILGTRDLFGDKDGLVKLERYARYQFGEDFAKWSPPSFILPDDEREFLVFASKAPTELFARKRLNTHSGAGVDIVPAHVIIEQLQKIRSSCGGDQSKDTLCLDLPFVVQRYVHDPLLIVHYKFDVRWWCLVTSTQPLRAYILPDGYAKIASSAPYDIRDVSSKCGHVTNNMVQKHCGHKHHHRHSLNIESSVRDPEFERRIFPIKTEDLFQGAQKIMEKVLLASAWRLETKRQTTSTSSKMFQLLAIDVIYERQDAKAVLLEINTNGYLRSGILKIPNGRDRLKELFRMTGFVGYDQAVVDHIRSSVQDETEIAVRLEDWYRGSWMPLFNA